MSRVRLLMTITTLLGDAWSRWRVWSRSAQQDQEAGAGGRPRARGRVRVKRARNAGTPCVPFPLNQTPQLKPYGFIAYGRITHTP